MKFEGCFFAVKKSKQYLKKRQKGNFLKHFVNSQISSSTVSVLPLNNETTKLETNVITKVKELNRGGR